MWPIQVNSRKSCGQNALRLLLRRYESGLIPTCGTFSRLNDLLGSGYVPSTRFSANLAKVAIFPDPAQKNDDIRGLRVKQATGILNVMVLFRRLS